MARLAVGMQQVFLAAWVEDGMRRDSRQVTEEIVEQIRRAFSVGKQDISPVQEATTEQSQAYGAVAGD